MSDEHEPWHYVRLNEASRYPRRIVCLDSESCRNVEAGSECHTFLLATASYDYIDPRTRQPRKTEWIETDDSLALWQWVTTHAKERERLVVFAHNLGYDLRITQALTILPTLGWRLRFISLDGRRCYARFARGTATISLSDSFSYLPKSLETIANELGMQKSPLPEPGEAADKFYARCRQDVEILRRAVLSVIYWLEKNDSGNFKPTGAAQSWATFRHHFLKPRSLLVHKDSDALAAERLAAWTGRTEAWRHGEYHYPLVEYDYRLAYATIAAKVSVPCRLLGARIYRKELREVVPRTGENSLYVCQVETDKPTVPTHVDGKIAWPVGTFATTLWDVEARLALENGARVYIERGWVYKSVPILREWGEWIIDALSIPNPDVPPLIRIMLKHWARCMIGRFGMRYPDWHYVGASVDSSLAHCPYYDYETETEGEYLQIANDWYTCDGRKDGHDTAPAVMSYIMAIQRVKMWQAIEAAGKSEVFYCDTDSLIVTPTAGRNLGALSATEGHGNLLRKAEHSHAEFYGPRSIVLDGEPRIAGLPRRATATSQRRYKLEAWQTLADSLKSGDPSSVRVSPRNFQIPTQDSRRKHLPNGQTEPFRISC